MASGFPSPRQRKLGPAPIASFEDLSDEHDNGSGEPVARMPGIVEVATPVTPGSSLKTPSTPRIDISRASSSSQHEDSNSRESTPEKELLAGMAPPEGSQLQLGYKEDVNDLRSSTEELDLHDPVHAQDLKREAKRARKRAKDLHDGTQSEHGISIKIDSSGDRERKDSNCSEIILLNISGRTSRISSVGSQGSAVSGGGISAVSSRSPSPHKCLLETSFCGSVSTLASNVIETTKPENEDYLAKIFLQREEDSTKAMIPESVRVPLVGGNMKPDPLDMPRRRGREERKEIFKREVEITKRVLKKVNIEVPIIKLPKGPDEQALQKPDSLDLNDKRKRSPSSASTSSRTATGGISSTALETPRLQRHQKIRDVEGSRTPSPSSVSRKSSFTSLFKGRNDGTSMQDSPSAPSSRRTSLASRLKEHADSLRSRSKSRERPGSSAGDRSPGKRPDSARSRTSSGAGGVFSSTLSLFRKRERKKSGDGIRTPDTLDGSHQNLDGIGKVEFTFNQQYHTPSKTSKEGDVIFISLYGENDEFRYKDEFEHKDETEQDITQSLPSESISAPAEELSPTRQLQQEYQDDDYNDASSPQQTSANIVCTDATIEHHRKSKSDRRSRISSSSGDSTRISESQSRDSQISSKSDPRNSRVIEPTEERRDSVGQQVSDEHRMSTGSRDSVGRPQPPAIPKPKRKCRSQPTKPTEPPPAPPPAKVEPPPPPTQAVQQPQQTQEPVQQQQPQLTNGRALAPPEEPLTKTPSVHSDLDRNSSGSDKEADIDFIKSKIEKEVEDVPDERKGLCGEESFEEDLPYVPTTLPLEKSVAVPILPVKQRLQEVRSTKPIERPRSTTPINPTLLDEYVQHEERHPRRGAEKMKISLPREDSFRLKSPHRPIGQQQPTFTEFAGRVTRGLSFTKSPSPPPPLPPRAPTTVLTTVPSRSAPPTGARPVGWINFEEIPEKRKAPKRIQTVPRLEDDAIHGHSSAGSGGQYSYVQPEECRCECHEESRRSLQRDTSTFAPRQPSPRQEPGNRSASGNSGGRNGGVCNGSGCPGSAPNADRASIISDDDSSNDYSLSADYTPGGRSGGLTVSGSRPFAMDLDVSSNRSSIISQEETEDEH